MHTAVSVERGQRFNTVFYAGAVQPLYEKRNMKKERCLREVVDLSKVEKELNLKLSQGFRSVFYLISKEVHEVSQELIKTFRTADCDECAHGLCEGITAEVLARLIYDIKGAGKTLTLLSESLEKEFVQRFPEDDMNRILTKDEDSLFWMMSPEQYDRYHKRTYFVTEMLSYYQENIKTIVENGIKDQLYKNKKESKP